MMRRNSHKYDEKKVNNDNKKVELKAMDNLLEQEARLNESVLKGEETIKLSQTSLTVTSVGWIYVNKL